MKRIFGVWCVCMLVAGGISLLTWREPSGVVASEAPSKAALEKLPTTHKQIASVDPHASGEQLRMTDFCLDGSGQLLVLVAAPQGIEFNAAGVAKPKAYGGNPSQVRVLDRDGKPLRDWEVPVRGTAINVAPDGSIIVGGDGKLVKFDAQGKTLATSDSPQMAVLDDPEELKARATEQLAEEKQQAEQQVKNLEEQIKNDGEKQKVKTSEGQEFEIDRKQQLDFWKKRTDQTVDNVVASMTARLREVNAVAAAGDAIYVACPGTKGYGYSIWRTDADFKNPKQIVTGLSGCCGQMDIQCHGDEIYVAENSRHRVVRYNRDGKRVGSFGKTDREGLGEGFGSCCNPMNLCFVDGQVLAAESNGLVKRFTLDGEYQGAVGAAQVPEGCKNSAIATSSDGSRLYYIDIHNGKIAVLERQAESAAK